MNISVGTDIVEAYCADPELHKCISGQARCSAEDGGAPFHVSINVSGCGSDVYMIYERDSGKLVEVFLHGTGCIAGVDIRDLMCMGTGIVCGN